MGATKVAGVRRSAHQRLRTLRRAAVAAAGLGPRSAAVTALHDRGNAPAAPAAGTRNSGLAYATADEQATTLVWLFNYWHDAYGIPEPDVDIRLVDPSGRSVAERRIRLAPDATAVVDVRDLCRSSGVGLPFIGQVLLSLEHEHLVAGRPLQMFVEYARDDGARSGVHGQYGLQRRAAGQVVGCIRAEGGRRGRTGVVVVNAFDGRNGTRPMRAAVEVRNADGRRLRTRLPALGPMASRMVWLDELFPSLDRFLSGRTGHARVYLPTPSSRLATVYDTGDRVIYNRAAVENGWSQQPGRPAGWTASAPVAACPVRVDERYDTRLTLPNVLGPSRGAYWFDCTVRAPDGAIVCRGRELVPEGGLRTVSLGRLLAGQGVDRCTGMAEITVERADAGDELPQMFDVLVGLERDGDLVAEALIGGEYLNGPVPPGAGLPDVRRTRNFGRVRVGDGDRTLVFLGHPAAVPGYDVEAHAAVTLVDLGGRPVDAVELTLPAHGSVVLDVAETFPGAREALGVRGWGMVKVRATDARLYGTHLVETDGATTAVFDHLVGG